MAKSQTSIGSASNLCQVALSYMFNFTDNRYYDHACILSVLAQLAIDAAKKSIGVDIPSEIARIKSDMDIKSNGYPRFWKCIHPEYKGYINNSLKCPMNEVTAFRAQKPQHNPHPIPNQQFFRKHELTDSKKKCKRVENLIQKYSIGLAEYNKSDEKEYEDYLLLREDFDLLVQDIRQTYISNNYLGLMSWLIDRALKITPRVASKADVSKSQLHRNRSLLLKVLYEVSPSQFLQCFYPSVDPIT